MTLPTFRPLSWMEAERWCQNKWKGELLSENMQLRMISMTSQSDIDLVLRHMSQFTTQYGYPTFIGLRVINVSIIAIFKFNIIKY